MSEHYFNALEHKIDQLLEYCRSLEAENQRLKKQEAELKDEKSQLMKLNNRCTTQIESMIQRLKALEERS